MAVKIPHMAYPFMWSASGHAHVLEQDYLEEVANCCEVILKCPVGVRIELPEFGTPDQTFRPKADPEVILGVLSRWEPRADTSIVRQVLFGADETESDVNIQIRGKEDV